MDIHALTQRAKEIKNKYSELEKNKSGEPWTNLNIMEGFVGDVGDLMKLVMAKEGVREMANVDKKLSHELSDCLWSILILADKYGINLEKSFLKTMDNIETKIKHS